MSDCIIKKVIKEHLNKILLESKDSECIKKFGHLLFGDSEDNYALKTWHKGKYEQNTKYEEMLWYKLETYVVTHLVNSQEKLEPFLKELYKCKSMYPNELDQNVKVLYRGMDVSESMAFQKKWLTKKWLKDFNPNDYHEWIEMTNSYQHKPEYAIESWTTKKNVAYEFMDYGNDIGILLKANIPHNQLLFNPKFMNVAFSDEVGNKEYEVLRIVKSPIKCSVYMRRDEIKEWM